MQEAEVVLTDLAEAKEIAEQNLNPARQTNVAFKELDWEADIPEDVRGSMSQVDLVIAADCTYNPDSR
jgi:methylase of polypeptide subunit release factors